MDSQACTISVEFKHPLLAYHLILDVEPEQLHEGCGDLG